MVENSYFVGIWKILHCTPLTPTIDLAQSSSVEGTTFQLKECGDVIWKPTPETDTTIPLLLCETFTISPDSPKTIMRFYGNLPDPILEFRMDIRKNVILLDYDDWCTLHCLRISSADDIQYQPYSLYKALEEGFFSDVTIFAKNDRKFSLHSTILSLGNPLIDWSESGEFYKACNRRIPEAALYTVVYYLYTESLPVNVTEDVAKEAVQAVNRFPGFERFVKISEMYLKSAALKQQIKNLVFDIHGCVTRIIDLFSEKPISCENSSSAGSTDIPSESIIASPGKLCYAISQSLRETAVACAKLALICDLFTRRKSDLAIEEQQEIIEFTRSRLVVFIGQVKTLLEIFKEKFNCLSVTQKHEIGSYITPEIGLTLTTTHDLLSQFKYVLERVISKTSSCGPNYSGHKAASKSKTYPIGSMIGDALRNAIHLKELKCLKNFYEKFVCIFMNIRQKRDRFSWMGTSRKLETVLKSWEQFISDDIPFFLQRLDKLSENFDEKLSLTEWKCIVKVGAATVAWILNKMQENKESVTFSSGLCDLVQYEPFTQTARDLGLLDLPADNPASTSTAKTCFLNIVNCLKTPPPCTESRLTKSALEMFRNGKNTDMSFEIASSQDELPGFTAEPSATEENHVINAHCVIVASRCDWFRRALLSGMKESIQKKILIHDTNEAAFTAFLEFLYCGYLDASHFSAEQLTDLLVISDRYEVEALRQISEQSLTSHLNDDTTLYLLSISDQFNSTILKSAAIDYITKHTNLLSCEDYTKLSEDMQNNIYHLVSWPTPRSLTPDQPLLSKQSSYSCSSSSSAASSPKLSPDRSSRSRMSETPFNEDQVPDELSLSEEDAARLEECITQLREIIGESVSQTGLIRLSLAADFDINRALNFFFSS